MKIIKIPFEGGALGRNKGCAQAPDKIIEALSSDTASEDSRVLRKEVFEARVEKNNFKKTNENVFSEVRKAGSGILVGGDHSITYSSFRASGCDGLVLFDAHPDLMPGTEIPSHEDFLRKLVEEKSADPKKVILFGIRSWHPSEMDFLKENEIKFFSMKDIFEFGVKNLTDTLMEMSRKFSRLYISIDIDAVDPAFAPGTGCCEAGGLSSREIIYVMQRMKHLKNLKFIDIAEVNSQKDRDGITVNLAAKIIREFAGIL